MSGELNDQIEMDDLTKKRLERDLNTVGNAIEQVGSAVHAVIDSIPPEVNIDAFMQRIVDAGTPGALQGSDQHATGATGPGCGPHRELRRS